MSKEEEQKILDFIREEYERIKFGKLLIEISIHRGKCTNIQCETKHSSNLLENNI
jgi:hypothetical protein